MQNLQHTTIHSSPARPTAIEKVACPLFSPVSGLAAAEAGDHLLRAYQQAQSDRRERNTIEADLQAKRAERSESDKVATRATLEIEELRQLAKLESPENLERAQGPLLARANKLFPRLTLGRYTGLRVGFDSGDEPVLRCVRDDGTEVGVEGLSDGTRDQLYLALRVATLEHHAESNDPMPVVVDDVLIHFDDTRAAAALEVLTELAEHSQVLFFTHHRHLIDLARATLPESARVEHELHLA